MIERRIRAMKRSRPSARTQLALPAAEQPPPIIELWSPSVPAGGGSSSPSPDESPAAGFTVMFQVTVSSAGPNQRPPPVTSANCSVNTVVSSTSGARSVKLKRPVVPL